MAVERNAKVTINVGMDEENMPENINWESTDNPMGNAEAKAFLLSFWDGKSNNTFRVDLWTKEMTVNEMNFFFFQNFITMADVFQRSTNNPEAANEIRDFAVKFGKKVGLEFKSKG